MNKLKNIAIIPARGGSKRIPQKNIKNFFGKPIIAYSIETAIKTALFNEIMVSTDDPEIAQISKKYGAVVPFLRDKNLADDYSTISDVLFNVIKNYEKIGLVFEYICCIYPTAPLISTEKIINAYNLLLKTGADSVLSVVKFSYPIQRALKIDNGKVKFVWPENLEKRSQDLEIFYHDAGQFCWIRKTSFLKYRTFFCPNTLPFIINEIEAQDIDNEEDWKLLEIKYKYKIFFGD